MSNSNKTVSIVFNGEIYNVSELRSQLVSSGYSFLSNSDTEVLLNLYLAHGTDFVDKLNGIFAFAIWDSNLGQLWICRDAFGVKPLYYAFTPGQFLCSSELKALHSFGLDFSCLDHVAIDNYLSFVYSPGDRTPSLGIYKLTPGSSLLVRDGKLMKKHSGFPCHQ